LECGVHEALTRIETGGANPSLDAIKTLADALKVELSFLFADL
jgi:transcriptional regulator with XRE-family HTH domain